MVNRWFIVSLGPVSFSENVHGGGGPGTGGGRFPYRMSRNLTQKLADDLYRQTSVLNCRLVRGIIGWRSRESCLEPV